MEFGRAALPHLDAATNLARWLMRDPAQADDVVQDSLVRAMTYFGGWRGGDFRPWLLRIVRNVAYDRMRARGVPMVSLEGEGDAHPAAMVADPAPDPEAAAMQREGMAGLDAMLAALPVELRECLILKELEEMSYKEIAQITEVPVGTVMSRLWRARQTLLAARREVSA